MLHVNSSILHMHPTWQLMYCCMCCPSPAYQHMLRVWPEHMLKPRTLAQDIVADREKLCVEFGKIDGVASMTNGPELLAALTSFGLQLTAFKNSPHFRIFKTEMRALQVSLQPMRDVVGIMTKVGAGSPPCISCRTP